jgi:hypothetical protein
MGAMRAPVRSYSSALGYRIWKIGRSVARGDGAEHLAHMLVAVHHGAIAGEHQANRGQIEGQLVVNVR